MSDTKSKEELAVRKLRDIVYGTPSTDKNWEYCKDYWLKDIEWLKNTASNKTKVIE